MAAGARTATGAEVGIAVTGVAGPGGGTASKPVGLVYLHLSAPGVERGQELRVPGGRAQVREVSAVAALHLVRTSLAAP
jgi:nicotinamide-nucleotide amidase